MLWLVNWAQLYSTPSAQCVESHCSTFSSYTEKEKKEEKRKLWLHFLTFIYSPSPRPTHCDVFRWNWEKPRVISVILILPIDYRSHSFPFQSHFRSARSVFSRPVHLWECTKRFSVSWVSVSIHIVRHLTTSGETGVTHTTRLSFQAVPFPLLWLCGSSLMSPCQLLFFWKGRLKTVQTSECCYFMCSPSEVMSQYEKWKMPRKTTI